MLTSSKDSEKFRVYSGRTESANGLEKEVNRWKEEKKIWEGERRGGKEEKQQKVKTGDKKWDEGRNETEKWGNSFRSPDLDLQKFSENFY